MNIFKKQLLHESDEKYLVPSYLQALTHTIESGYLSFIEAMKMKNYIKDDDEAKLDIIFSIIGIDLVGMKNEFDKKQFMRVRNLIYAKIKQIVPGITEHSLKQIENYEILATKSIEDGIIPPEKISFILFEKWLGNNIEKIKEIFGMFYLIPMMEFVTERIGIWLKIIHRAHKL